MLEISQISCRLADGGDERSCIEACTREALGILRCRRTDIERVELRRKSIDARKKSNVHFTLSALVHLASEVDEADLLSHLSDRDRKRVRAVDADDPSSPAPVQDGLCEHRPVVVGAGCAGLFAALTLAEAGLRPILLERGDDATRRTEAVGHFNATGVLDTESNIQFGLGGAGTFSDGKLNTGTKNPLHRLVLKTLVEAGAPRDILWDAKPHIGSDILPDVVTNLIARIERLGGTVRFRTHVSNLLLDDEGIVSGLILDGPDGRETIAATHVVLACGHSARDVFEMLSGLGITLQRKTFAMGVRIEHPQI